MESARHELKAIKAAMGLKNDCGGDRIGRMQASILSCRRKIDLRIGRLLRAWTCRHEKEARKQDLGSPFLPSFPTVTGTLSQGFGSCKESTQKGVALSSPAL
eukprot:6454967-Amphidinium_carterae.1